MSFNIYVLDESPALAVQALSDRHLLGAHATALSVLETATVLRAWAAWRELRGPTSGGPSLRGLAHPRHPITRHAARSAVYAAWVHRYGKAAVDEIDYRGLRSGAAPGAVGAWATNALLAIDEAYVDLVRETAACPVLGRRLPDEAFELVDFPQRLDGGPDLAVAGEPVAAYRKWYELTKVPGAPLAWEGASVTWTRRQPPAWLSVEVAPVPWCGMGPRAAHDVFAVRWLTPRS